MDKDARWLKPSQAVEHFDVCEQTLRNWANSGKIKHKETIGGHRRYLVPVLGKHEPNRSSIVYARVSSTKQKPDLERQKNYLRTKYPDHELVFDIGSGVNFERPGLRSLLERCMQGSVAEVVVSHRDRLARIGFKLVAFVIERTGCVLTILDDPTGDGTRELAEDVMAVLTHFTAKHNGRRSYRHSQDSHATERSATCAI